MTTNRSLRFRVWDKIGREWLFPNPNMADWSGGGKNSICFWCYKDTGLGVHSLSTGTVEITQFTGLTDANGVDIYEGDIVENGNHRGDVRFGNGMFYINPVIELRPGEPRYMGSLYWGEVIGNIFESPDLLK